MSYKTFSTLSNSYSREAEQVQRISRQEVKTLKRVNASNSGAFIVRALASFFRLFTAPLARTGTRDLCKNYGHIILDAWQSCYPNCGDCGVKITSPDQLRKQL